MRSFLLLVTRFVAVLCGLVAFAVLAAPARSQPALAESSPRLQRPPGVLDEPFTAPILVGLHLAGGAGTAAGQGTPGLGYGGEIVFRPGAVNFLDFLYRWHAGIVLQVDHQRLGDGGDVLSADGLIRRYLRDRGRGDTEVRLFFGAGLGATRIAVPGTGGAGLEKDWSLLAELGQEWLVRETWLFSLRAQYRVYMRPHTHWGVWSVQAGAGVPWPF